jgi:signal transduction histidine kinase
MRNKLVLMFIFITLVCHFMPADSLAGPRVASHELRHQEPITSLAGSWEFYWQQLLKPDDFRHDQFQPKVLVSVPSSWQGLTLNTQVNRGQPLPRFGYATYRKLVTIPEDKVGTAQALFFRYVDSAYLLWIDGQAMGGLGTVGTSQATEDPALRMRMFYFTPTDSQIEIVLQVSNYSFRESGVIGESLVGDANELTLHVLQKVAVQDLIFISFFGLLSIYHLILYFTRRYDYSFLWLGLLTLMIALRTFLISEYLVYIVLPEFPWTAIIRTEYIIEVFAMVFFTLYWQQLYRDDVHRWPFYLNLAYSAVLLGYFSFTPTSVFTTTLAVHWLIYLAIISYYLFYLGVVTVIRRRLGAYLNMIGIAVVLIGILNDILYFTNVIQLIPLSSIALLIYFLLQAVIVAFRYSMLYEENRQLTGALKKLNLDLEGKVATRTEELRAVNVQLLTVDRQRTRLMENIAHDLGSPIVGAQTQVQLLKEGKIPVDQQPRVHQSLLVNLSYMKRLVQDLFDMSGFDRAKTTVELNAVRGADLWLLLVGCIHEKCTFGQIVLERETQEHAELWGDKMFLVDRTGLVRVLQNLLDNAIKFSEEEPSPVGFRAYFADGQLTFELTDHGPGIAPEQLPHVFERFYKGEGFTKGVGIGLAIVKEIVEQHGGCVSVQSEVGKGSQFRFSVPSVIPLTSTH